jgi:hypothetical protein
MCVWLVPQEALWSGFSSRLLYCQGELDQASDKSLPFELRGSIFKGSEGRRELVERGSRMLLCRPALSVAQGRSRVVRASLKHFFATTIFVLMVLAPGGRADCAAFNDNVEEAFW